MVGVLFHQGYQLSTMQHVPSRKASSVKFSSLRFAVHLHIQTLKLTLCIYLYSPTTKARTKSLPCTSLPSLPMQRDFWRHYVAYVN